MYKSRELLHANTMDNIKQKQNDTNVKNVVIVGASSGIGYEIALRLLSQNCIVYNISRTHCLLEGVENFIADISNTEEFNTAIDSIVNRVEHIDILIYAAAFSMASSVEYAKQKDYYYLMQVNYFGAVQTVQKILPKMKENGGRIFFISCSGAILPVAFDSFYSSSKAALNMLAKGLAVELEPYSIEVCSVLPTSTATNFTYKRKLYTDDENKEYAAKMKKATTVLANMEQNGLAASEVAKMVVSAIDQKHLPTFLHCGIRSKLFAVANRVLPTKAMHYINKKIYKQ